MTPKGKLDQARASASEKFYTTATIAQLRGAAADPSHPKSVQSAALAELARRGRATVERQARARFTEGSWHVAEHASLGTIAEIATPLGRHMIRIVADRPVTTANADADARLIAAAPDLYAALSELTQAAEAALGPSISGARSLPLTKDGAARRVDRARAALAKAEGR